jgi:hypothetical protein
MVIDRWLLVGKIDLHKGLVVIKIIKVKWPGVQWRGPKGARH